VWSSFEKTFGIGIQYSRPGYLFLARNSSTAEQLSRKVETQNEHGIDSWFVSPRETTELYPSLRAEKSRGGAYVPTDGFASQGEEYQSRKAVLQKMTKICPVIRLIWCCCRVKPVVEPYRSVFDNPATIGTLPSYVQGYLTPTDGSSIVVMTSTPVVFSNYDLFRMFVLADITDVLLTSRVVPTSGWGVFRARYVTLQLDSVILEPGLRRD